MRECRIRDPVTTSSSSPEGGGGGGAGGGSIGGGGSAASVLVTDGIAAVDDPVCAAISKRTSIPIDASSIPPRRRESMTIASTNGIDRGALRSSRSQRRQAACALSSLVRKRALV